MNTKAFQVRIHFVKIFLYLIVLMLVFLLFIFYRSYLMFVLVTILLGLPIISIGAARYTFGRLSVAILPNRKTIGKKMNIPIRLQVDNPCIFPFVSLSIPYVVSHQFYPNDRRNIVNVAALIRRKSSTTISIASDYCGVIEVTASELIGMDYLGFLTLRKPVSCACDIYIMPEKVVVDWRQESQGYSGREEEIDSLKKGNDTSSITDIRGYHPGDRRQTIHWKLSVKRDELMVKEYASSTEYKTMILLELFRDSTHQLDGIIDLFYSIAMEILDSQEIFCVCWWSARLGNLQREKVRDEESLLSFLHLLYYEKTYETVNKAYEEFLRSEDKEESILYIGVGKENEMVSITPKQ